jgi:polysaccharide export outer membrane protein
VFSLGEVRFRRDGGVAEMAAPGTFLRAAALVVLMVAMLALAGCAGTRGGPIPYNVENFGAPDAPSTMLVDEDYKIGPLDTLRITVFQVPDLSGDFEVDLTGRVALPLIGVVRAVDMTTAELDQALTRQLTQKYLTNPDVAVALKASTRRNLTIDGAVRTPGQYPVNGPTTLMQAIALARGTDENANPRRIAIFRQIEGKRMAAAFDLTSIRRGSAEDPKVYSGDIIIVDGSNIKQIQREILQALPLVGLFNPIIY